ncbi:hypothetical protein LSH36_798g01061 [Paralvinella palmiformis]|uniref:Uncharacterized protein n=1 Tax=Paralvinella palmiformis TaxID=53620 RepID=A0AAD9MTW1_9ANNE|nr:hypothetical protein LSH36_798g01061 [Paralvinella palmiformis]
MSLDVASCPSSGPICGIVAPPGQNACSPGFVLGRTIPDPNGNNSFDKTALIIKISAPPSGEPVSAAGKGKRGPSGPIVTTSDEDECPDSPRDGAGGVVRCGVDGAMDDKGSRTFSPPMLDHDYENISSPGNSSTASGPTYVRQPGFSHHAHEVTVSKPRVKKKKTTLLCVKDGLRRREPTPPRNKPKRDWTGNRLREVIGNHQRNEHSPGLIHYSSELWPFEAEITREAQSLWAPEHSFVPPRDIIDPLLEAHTPRY